MTQDKAREFFSAYYEGTLEPGLRQAFEHRLTSDSTLQADYAAFAETMEELDLLPHEEIEIPMFLNDRIAQRLQPERDRKRNRVPVWTVWLRGLAFGSLATAALAFAFISVNHQGGGTANASLGDPGAGDRVSFVTKGSDLVMDYHPSAEKTVVVSSGISGKEMRRFTVNSSAPMQPLKNAQAGTALFQIQVLGQTGSTLVAVPGTQTHYVNSGDGSMSDFAVALADRFRTSVVVRVSDPTDHVAWKFDGTDVRRAADSALKDTPYMVDQPETGILNIMDR